MSGKLYKENTYEKGLSKANKAEAKKLAKENFEKSLKSTENYKTYEKLKKSKDYTDVAFDLESGGMKATHKNHKFDKKRGFYEKEVQNLFYKKGDKFILESELGFDKQIEGFLNNEAVEIKTILGSSSRTIRKRLKEAIAKNAEIVILYYPNNFSQKRLSEALDSKHFKSEIKVIVVNKDETIRDDR